MDAFQINQPQTTKLLENGSEPRLLTTRIIAVRDIVNSENHETANAAHDDLLSDSPTASSTNSKPKLPTITTVKLLGKLKGGMPGEKYALPGECPKCRKMSSLHRGETLCSHCRLPAQFDALIKERKLSSAAWEKIRCTLCLPTKIKNFSAEQARATVQLLNSFANKVSFDEQEGMTREQIKTVLVKLPQLPKLFRNSLNGAASCGCTTNAKRKPISARKFKKVARLQGLCCFWCGIKVIRIAQIPQENRVSKNSSTIVYLTDRGEVCEKAFGTIDHLVRVADGGGNSLGNIVISCYPCNQMCDRQTNA